VAGIHATLDFHIDMAIVDEPMQVAMVHDVRGENCHRDVHVGIVQGQNWGAQIKVFEVA